MASSGAPSESDDIIPTITVRAGILIADRARVGRELVVLVPPPSYDIEAQARRAVIQLLAELEPVLTRELAEAIRSRPVPTFQGD